MKSKDAHKSAPGTRRSKSTGVGFGSIKKPSAETTKASQDGDNDDDDDVLLEQTSGAEGDATPHRALTQRHELQDPSKSIDVMFQGEALVITEKEQKELRIEWGTDLDILIERLEDERKAGNLEKAVAVNRHLITEALLYRFTSAILQIEGTGDDTRQEEMARMRALRQGLISLCFRMDMPMKQGVLDAEQRLMKVLQADNVRKETELSCGSVGLEVDAFWLVVYAAIAAWEEQGTENEQLVNVDVQNALKTAAETCANSPRISSMLTPALKVTENVLSSADPAKQSEMLADIADETVVELATFVEQMRMFPSNAYGALRRRMQTILDFVLGQRYNLPPAALEPCRFELQEIKRGSKLVQFAENARTRRRAL